VDVVANQPVSGGCISDAQRLELADGRVVLAKSGAGLPSGLLAVEAAGLRWLAEAGGIAIPEVVGDGDGEVLLLEWIEPGAEQADTAERLGRGLALLHAAGAPTFGWRRDGFIGPLPQANTPSASEWSTFWFGRRIEPLSRQAVDAGSLDPRAAALVERLGGRLTELVGPPEPPARVHGDLWSGNVLVGAGGRPWLVDPAPYGGHREADLAMLHLFGSPGPGFISAYQEVSPLAEGWRERLSLWQLEPLLVHAVLFGGGYGTQAHSVLRRFT
jgi:fructosamine-3-kinase